ncbi:MAG: coproporphyrinogen dehydrogenase HemZ [Clostridia bacterium]|nr:coproporphyrinogen dehydrogenase HemZ [Clostridia bacterium]
MKISLEGNINRTYIQGLCMAFFHGISFPKNEEDSQDGLELFVSAKCENDKIISSAILQFNETKTSHYVEYTPIGETSLERALKTATGQAVYFACNKLTGIELEWGILTGIRPSKVCAELLCEYSQEKAYEILTKSYLLKSEKAQLVLEVTKNEMAIMSLTDDEKCSIYISIPFCPSRCTYCSFISYAGKKLFDLIPSYVDKIVDDIEHTASLIKELKLKVSCIYIGGGTPTILNEIQLERILGKIKECIDVESLDEFTLEGGRPDTITTQKLEIAKKYGVTRISVNPQTLNDSVLEKIGRKHTVNDFLEAFDKVKASRISSINTDLIAGLEGDGLDSFMATVDRIVELGPDNITIHTFCVKKSAQILRDDAQVYERDAEDVSLSVKYAYEKLIASGYAPYYMYRQKNTIGNLENVGYARIGYFGLYNVFMMSDAHTVFGIGAGATTKLVKNDGKTEILRIFSPKYPYEYLRDIQKTDDKIREFFDRR